MVAGSSKCDIYTYLYMLSSVPLLEQQLEAKKYFMPFLASYSSAFAFDFLMIISLKQLSLVDKRKYPVKTMHAFAKYL